MGKKKQIILLELEVDRLRKNVIDYERVIDKLLSDTITDQEKNVIKWDRHFAKATAAEFDKYLLSGKTHDYRTVSKVCDFYDNLKNNPNLVPGEGNINPEDTDHIISTKEGRQYRHTEDGDNEVDESIWNSICKEKYIKFNINLGDKFTKEVEYNGDGTIKTKITYPDQEGAPKTMADIHDDINLMETIASMSRCNLSDKEEIERLKKENEELSLSVKNHINLSFEKVKENIETQNAQTQEISKLLDERVVFIAEIERLKRMIDLYQLGEKRDQLHNAIKDDFNKHLLRESIAVITEVPLGGDTEIAVYKNSGNCFVYNTEEKYRSIPFDDMYNLWKEGKVRIMDPLEFCEDQECAPAKEEEHIYETHPECKTSEKWLAEIPSEYKVQILDPDGWNRSNYEYSFKTECITKDEFRERLSRSTISNDVLFWTSEWAKN